MNWYKDYGFEYNPFTIKPIEEYDLFFDNKNVFEEVIDLISQGKNVLVKGGLGTGKSSILKKIISEFSGDKKLYYYNAYRSPLPINYDKILKGAGNFFSRNLKIKSKDVILFIDEAQHLKSDSLKELKNYLGDYFRAVVIASSNPRFKLPKDLHSSFKNVLNITKFTSKDAKNMIMDRLGDDYSNILDDREIKNIHKKSSTPREFLLKCDEFVKNKDY